MELNSSALLLIKEAELSNRHQEIITRREVLLKKNQRLDELEKLYKKLPCTSDAKLRNADILTACSNAHNKLSKQIRVKNARCVTEYDSCMHEYNKMVAMKYQKWRQELKNQKGTKSKTK